MRQHVQRHAHLAEISTRTELLSFYTGRHSVDDHPHRPRPLIITTTKGEQASDHYVEQESVYGPGSPKVRISTPKLNDVQVLSDMNCRALWTNHDANKFDLVDT